MGAARWERCPWPLRLAAALSGAARYWAGQDGAPPLIVRLDQAVTTFEPLLNARPSRRDGA